MSTKKKNWIRSAFSADEFEGPSTKRNKTASPSPSLSQNATLKNDSNFDLPNVPISEKAIANVDCNSSNFLENFSPRNVSELAIHPKKITEVQDWLLDCETIKQKYPNQILLVTGPAGCGKTVTIKTVAKDLGFELVEWITPLDVDLINNNGQMTYKESQIEMFKRFLFRSSRYKSIFETLDKRLILVEDFPNAIINDSQSFNGILENYKNYGKSPLIFIATDSRSKRLNIAHNLFPSDVISLHNISEISFNPVSTTLMKKALSRICSLMTQDGFKDLYKVPNQDIIESINLASQGDIRNAVINLHFASLKGAPQVKTDTVINPTKKSRGKGKKLSEIGRDKSITIMHALGRVFNPKYIEDKTPKIFLHSPEDLADAFSSEPRNFVDFIHSNYLTHFATIENVLGAVDSISESDNLLNEYRDECLGLLGLNVAIRGVMVYNEKPVAGWIPVKGLKKINKESKLESEMRNLGINQNVSRNDFVADFRTYVRIINGLF